MKTDTPSKGSKVSLKHTFKTIVWPRRKTLLIGLLLIAINRPAGLVLPYMIKFLVDDVFGKNDITQLQSIVLLVTGAIFIQAVTSFLLTRILSVEAQHFISELRVKVQKKILSLPVNYFDNNKSGALVSRIMTDVEGVRNLVGTGVVQLVGGTITSIASLVILINYNLKLTLYLLIPVIVFGIIALKAFKFIRPIFRKRGKINAEVTGRLTETLNGIRVIKGFNAEQQEIDTFEEGVTRLFLNIKKSLTSTAFITSSSTFLLGMASVTLMKFGGEAVVSDPEAFSSGTFLSFTMYLGFLVAPIVQMSNIGSQLTEAFAGLDRTQEIMNMEPENDESVRVNRMDSITGDISFKDVHFSYEEEKEVLHGISFDAPAGSVTALVGSSGSGKSTIAGLAATFLNPSGGLISIDGVDLTTVSLGDYRSKLGVVLQDDFLFEGTIRENILFPCPSASEEELMEAVNAAYVNEFTDRFDEGLDTVIGERGVKLSGGQRQRIAIARAILADPRILILDEATSNLDTESEALIQKSLTALMKGRTTFVIAHRLSTIRQADQILVIEQGHIEERGNHDELIAQKGRYFDLFTYQAKI